MVFNFIFLLVLAVYSQDSPCLTDGSEYQVSDAIYGGCTAQKGISEVNVMNNQEVWIMLIPEHVLDLNLTLVADVDVDILVKDAEDMTATPVPCLIGAQADCTYSQPLVQRNHETISEITYSGDQYLAPGAAEGETIKEFVYIRWTDRKLAYAIRAHGQGTAFAYYEYSGILPCPQSSGECKGCDDYTGCKSPYQAVCDGTSDVTCQIPTEEPTLAPTMSEYEILYRACSQEILECEWEKGQLDTILGHCTDRGISCTHAPTFDPTPAPTALPSVVPTDKPTSAPTPYPTKNPTTTEPSNPPTNSPTDFPSWSPTCDCYNLVPEGETKWYDSHGEKYDCEWYERDPSRFCSDSDHFDNFGLTSKQACCICRGGSCASPTFGPSVAPTKAPTDSPTVDPTLSPTDSPTKKPSFSPTEHPSMKTTDSPSDAPTATPTSDAPTFVPSSHPTDDPTKTPTSPPTPTPSHAPTSSPSRNPTQAPTKTPTSSPTMKPTDGPTFTAPTTSPTDEPTRSPTNVPSFEPTPMPSQTPSEEPTSSPTSYPTSAPSSSPSEKPSASPSCECKDLRPVCPDDSDLPEDQRADCPPVWVDNYGNGYGCDWYAQDPRFCTYEDEHYRNWGLVAKDACCACGGGSCNVPTTYPSVIPTFEPTMHPVFPTEAPTRHPTPGPSVAPTKAPTDSPTPAPTYEPTPMPSGSPLPCGKGGDKYTGRCNDLVPEESNGAWYDKGGMKYTCDWYESDPERFCEHDGESYRNFGSVARDACCICGGGSCYAPTSYPTLDPSTSPTDSPTVSPTDNPSNNPTPSPTSSPTNSPSPSPTPFPTHSPSYSPTEGPTPSPTDSPTNSPTPSPTPQPTPKPTGNPTKKPTPGPTFNPTDRPTPSTNPPTAGPTKSPTDSPTLAPSVSPTDRPTHSPTDSPTTGPTVDPTTMPTDSPTFEPSFSPTTSPTFSPVCDPCYDLVPQEKNVPEVERATWTGEWHDAYGPTYTCSFYEIDPWRFCEYDAQVYRWPPIGGLVANQACCVCGGGSCAKPSRSPTVGPTVSPSKAPTPSPTDSPTDGPTMSPSDNPTKSPETSKPSVGPHHHETTETPTTTTAVPTTTTGTPTKDPTPSPTGPPTEPPTTCDYELGRCEEALENLQQELGCEECEETVVVVETTTGDRTYPDSMVLETVSTSEVTDVDAYTASKIGIEGLKVYNGEFVVATDKEGSDYARTCVAYSAVASAECDSSTYICAGGDSFGWGPQMANNINEALVRADFQHPSCPTGCNDVSSWYVEQLAAAGVTDSLCLVDNEAVYRINSDGSKSYTCVGMGDAESNCSNSDVVCSGTRAGLVTYGYPSSIISTLKVALGEENFMHPQCPECCACN